MKNLTLFISLIISATSFGQSVNPGWFYNSTDGTESDDLKLGSRNSNTVYNYVFKSDYSSGITNLKTSTGAWGTYYYWQRGSSAGTQSIARIGGSESAGHSFVLYSKTDGATGNIVLRSNGDTYFNGGNVGIGYTTPSSKLHVQGQDAAFFSGSAENNLHFGRDNNQKLQIKVNDNHLYFDLVQDEDQNGSHVMYFRNLAAGTSTNNDIRFQTSNTDRLTIKDNGNVGIGTSDPTFKLKIEEVSGSFSFGRPGTEMKNRLTIDANSSYENQIYFRSNPGRIFTVGENIIFGNSPTTNNMVISGNNGYVGIGTTTPESLLTVAGNIKSQEVKVTVDAGQGPDYVFEADYNLRSLEETEEYIKANKHLPEVPSAKVMESEGLNLKEMNLMLLQKIEELTLHQIEQNKSLKTALEKIESLENEIETLKEN